MFQCCDEMGVDLRPIKKIIKLLNWEKMEFVLRRKVGKTTPEIKDGCIGFTSQIVFVYDMERIVVEMKQTHENRSQKLANPYKKSWQQGLVTKYAKIGFRDRK
jgi:hypothetical protein